MEGGGGDEGESLAGHVSQLEAELGDLAGVRHDALARRAAPRLPALLLLLRPLRFAGLDATLRA